MKTQIKTITPALAAQYLKMNATNRRLRLNVVSKYANDMRNGNWVLTHQGIAFSDKGELIDGQHRLSAILESETPIEMLVSFGIPEKANGNGVSIIPMDAVDRGVPRLIGDQLCIRHGYANGRLVASCCSVITSICAGTGGGCYGLTIPITLQIINEFKHSILYAIDEMSRKKGLRAAAVLGSVAFAHDTEPGPTERFYEQLVSGEGLKKGDPVYALREYILGPTGGTAGNAGRLRAIMALFNALDMQIGGKPCKGVRFSSYGLDKFIEKQQVKVAKVRSLFGLSNS